MRLTDMDKALKVDKEGLRKQPRVPGRVQEINCDEISLLDTWNT